MVEMSERDKRIAKYLKAIGGGLAVLSPALPDTNVGSPRAICFALSLVLIAVATQIET